MVGAMRTMVEKHTNNAQPVLGLGSPVWSLGPVTRLTNPRRYHIMLYVAIPELHADLFSRHASPLEVYAFVAVANRGEDVMSDEILSSIPWKRAMKTAEWPKCAAPRLVYDSALFYETCMRVYVRTTYDQIYSAKIKSIPRR